MRKIVVSVHMSLDGFVAGPNGEMDWIHVDEDLFNHIVELTNMADAGMYGRKTFEMMDAYWPTAAEQPDASQHDIDHSRWYNTVQKYVLSSTLQSSRDDVHVLTGDVAQQVRALKATEGRNIQIFGSPSAAKFLFANHLVDEFWIFVNPVILGKGISIFNPSEASMRLELVASHTFQAGIVELHYRVVN